MYVVAFFDTGLFIEKLFPREKFEYRNPVKRSKFEKHWLSDAF